MNSTVVGLGFAGFCKTDMILYISRILHILGEKVAIIDRTQEQELRFSVPVGIYESDRLDYRGIEVFLGCGKMALEELPLDDFTVILVDLGVRLDVMEDMKSIRTLFVISDMQRHHIIPLSNWITKIPSCPDTIRILRDISPGKIHPRYVDAILQTEKYTNIIAKYEFMLNEKEYANRLKSQYDDVFSFPKIPEDFKTMLIDCMVELFGVENKSAIKAVRKAQKGG